MCCCCGQLTKRQRQTYSVNKSAVAVAACIERRFSDKLSLQFPFRACTACTKVAQLAVQMARWGFPSCSAFSKTGRGNAATEASSVISCRGMTLRAALNKMTEGVWCFFVGICIAIDHFYFYLLKVISMVCAPAIYRRTQKVSQSTIS